jgi:alpha-tubulin suppressor-like RCC1 family protein
MDKNFVGICKLSIDKTVAAILQTAKAVLVTASVLVAGCGGDGGSSENSPSSPQTSLPIPRQVQAKINADATNVEATISIDGGAEQPMTISGRAATFQASGLSAGAHQIVIRFYQTFGEARIILAQSTSEVTVVAGETASVAPAESSYDTASYDEDEDDIPNVLDEDNDNDGISDENEVAYGWNPLNDDSDGDGVKDGDEVPVLAIATPIPAGVLAKIGTDGVVVDARIAVDDGTEQDMTIDDGKANFNVLALLPGNHAVVITFYQRFGSERIVLARHTANVAVVAGEAATLGEDELEYDTAFDQDEDDTPNIADSDNDGDDVADVDDPFPLDGNESVDSDDDGIGNAADPDDDNDDVPDTSDAFPLDPDESLDTDEDGTGNNADTDDDADGIADTAEAGYGKNPLSADSDNDDIPDADEVAVQVSGRGDHTCIVLLSRKVRCWGYNADGELGNGDSGSGAFSFVPVATSGITNALSVHTSPFHSCARLNGGQVRCWGSNDFEEIADGTVDSDTPLEVASLANASDLQLTTGVTCGIVADGALACRGDVASADLDANPIKTYIGDELLAAGPGDEHGCVVRPNRSVSCYGNYTWGQLGNNNVLLPPGGPVVADGISTATKVGVGANHSCALLQNGTVQCWGANAERQIGDGTTNSQPVPTDVNTVSGATALAVGLNHNCALLDSGSVRCWGDNSDGQLGNGSTTGSIGDPVLVTGITNAISISAGQSHSCAVLANGRVQCWGSNADGQLGNGQAPDALEFSRVPVYVSGF